MRKENMDFDDVDAYEFYLFALQKLFTLGILKSYDFSRSTHTFNCPLCGDKKRRGNLSLIKNKGSIYGVYKCWNGGCEAEDGIGPIKFLSRVSPGAYSEYTIESFSGNIKKTSKAGEIIKEESEEEKYKKEMEEFSKLIPISAFLNKKHENYNEIMHAMSSNDKFKEIFKLTGEMFNSRNITKNLYKTWYIGFYGKYEGRVVIPFYDSENNIKYFTARSVYKDVELRYKNPRLKRGINSIYNWFKVNKNLPIIATEGLIDSEFIENSIAMLSVKVTEECENEFLKSNAQIYYLFDNDPAGKKASIKKLNEGQHVFNWFMFLNDLKVPESISNNIKDINDLVCNVLTKVNTDNKLTFKQLQKYFTNSTYDIPVFNE